MESVVNFPTDLGCLRRLAYLPELQRKARAANRRLVDATGRSAQRSCEPSL